MRREQGAALAQVPAVVELADDVAVTQPEVPVIELDAAEAAPRFQAPEAPQFHAAELSLGVSQSLADAGGVPPSIATSNVVDTAGLASWFQQGGRGSLSTALNESAFAQVMKLTGDWGWWFPPEGGAGGGYFLDLCEGGTWFNGFVMRAGVVIDQIGPTPCSNGHVLGRHGLWGGQPFFDTEHEGYTEYGLRIGGVVDMICMGEKFCHGGGAATSFKRFACPKGSRIAGVTGRAGRLVDAIGFFCGCPKGTKKTGTTCGPLHSPRDCKWKSWGPWTDCSRSCGGGQRTRSRDQIREKHGGEPCGGSAHKAGDCNMKPCPTTTETTTRAVAQSAMTMTTAPPTLPANTTNTTNTTMPVPPARAKAGRQRSSAAVAAAFVALHCLLVGLS